MSWLPNAFTICRCVLSLFVGYAIIVAPPAGAAPGMIVLPLVLFVALAATDAVDGYLARKLDAVSEFGALLDPIADKLLVAISLLGICYVQGWPALLTVSAGAIIVRDSIITYLRFRPGRSLPVSQLAKAKTALEMIGVSGLLLVLVLARFGVTDGWSFVAQGFALAVAAAAILSVWTCVQYLRIRFAD